MTTAVENIERKRLKFEREQANREALFRLLGNPAIQSILGCVAVELLQHIELKRTVEHQMLWWTVKEEIQEPLISPLLGSGLEIGLIVNAMGGVGALLTAASAIERAIPLASQVPKIAGLLVK